LGEEVLECGDGEMWGATEEEAHGFESELNYTWETKI
jgi:hypothetical protein